MNKKEIAEILERLKDNFTTLEDGFVYYFPSNDGGCYNSYHLRVIADELDARNKAWADQIDAYFEKEHPEDQPELWD